MIRESTIIKAKVGKLAVSGIALAGAVLGMAHYLAVPASADDKAIAKALTDWCTKQYGGTLSAANANACNTPPRSPTQVKQWCLKFQANRASSCETDFTQQVNIVPSLDQATGGGKPSGVCNQDAAMAAFYKSVPALKRIKDNLDTSIAGIGKDEANYPKARFGHEKNATAQESNRNSLKAYLTTAKEQIEARISLSATQADKDCFHCAVAEKWAVLKGAARLLSYTYTFIGGDGLKVGSGAVNVLWKTMDDSPEDAGLSYPKRPIAVQDSFLETVYGPHTTSKLVLDELSDQWMSALNPESVEKLKVEICKIVNTKENAYSNKEEIYFKYAKGVQEEINRLFTSADPSAAGKTNIEAAFAATMMGTGATAASMAGAEKMSVVNGRILTIVDNRVSSKQCDPATTKMELNPYNEPPLGYHPSYCKLKQYGGTQ